MINRTILVGRVTKDLELRQTQSNISCCNFTLAVNRSFKSKDGEQEADFINCVAWKKQADNLVKFQKKGSLLGIEGRIQTRNYNDDKGVTRYITEIVCDNIQYLDSKKSNENQSVEDDKKDTFDVGSNCMSSVEKTEVVKAFKEFETEKQMVENTIEIPEDDLPF